MQTVTEERRAIESAKLKADIAMRADSHLELPRGTGRAGEQGDSSALQSLGFSVVPPDLKVDVVVGSVGQAGAFVPGSGSSPKLRL